MFYIDEYLILIISQKIVKRTIKNIEKIVTFLVTGNGTL